MILQEHLCGRCVRGHIGALTHCVAAGVYQALRLRGVDLILGSAGERHIAGHGVPHRALCISCGGVALRIHRNALSVHFLNLLYSLYVNAVFVNHVAGRIGAADDFCT